MPVSIKDIAKKANVSPSTVSRALNDHPRISEETKAHIRELAENMGYVPSQIARNLVSKQSATIGVAIADFLDPFYGRLLASIEEAAIAHDYDLFVGSFYRDQQRELRLFEAFCEKRLAGAIVAGSLADEAYLSARQNLPLVFVNRGFSPFSITVNQSLGAKKAMEHLLNLGHRRIAYVSLGSVSRTEMHRFNRYCQSLEECGLPVDETLIVPGDGRLIGGIKAADRLLTAPQPPTAILCYNDMTALGVINGLKQKGYEVPRDVSVVGFDDLEISAQYYPSLTSVRQPIFDLGQKAANMLFGLLQGRQDLVQERLEPELIVRASTAPPKM